MDGDLIVLLFAFVVMAFVVLLVYQKYGRSIQVAGVIVSFLVAFCGYGLLVTNVVFSVDTNPYLIDKDKLVSGDVVGLAPNYLVENTTEIYRVVIKLDGESTYKEMSLPKNATEVYYTEDEPRVETYEEQFGKGGTSFTAWFFGDVDEYLLNGKPKITYRLYLPVSEA